MEAAFVTCEISAVAPPVDATAEVVTESSGTLTSADRKSRNREFLPWAVAGGLSLRPGGERAAPLHPPKTKTERGRREDEKAS